MWGGRGWLGGVRGGGWLGALDAARAGAGSVFDALRAGKRTIVVVNGALMGNHQEELAAAMAAAGHVVRAAAPTTEALVAALADPRLCAPAPLPPPALHTLRGIVDADLGFAA